MKSKYVNYIASKYCNENGYNGRERIISKRSFTTGYNKAILSARLYLEQKGMISLAKELDEKLTNETIEL